jgi:hypothetical protein
MKSFDLTGAHPSWSMYAEFAKPTPAQGHGWVRPLPSGAKARCGGPAICRQCQLEQEGIPAVVRRLAAQGLKPHNIAACLRLSVDEVEQAMCEDIA